MSSIHRAGQGTSGFIDFSSGGIGSNNITLPAAGRPFGVHDIIPICILQ